MFLKYYASFKELVKFELFLPFLNSFKKLQLLKKCYQASKSRFSSNSGKKFLPLIISFA